MNAAQIIVDIVNCGGSIYMEDGRLKVKGIPAALVSVVKSHKVALMALLSPSTPAESIQNEDVDQRDTAAAQPELRKKPLLPAEYAMPQQECASSASGYMGTERVCCRDCRCYLPGEPLPSQSLGRCLATVNGSPPSGGYGYKACFPLATRRCPQFMPI
ncbi:MAG: hypothetical protein ACYCPA_01290 [Acidithiobacillus sp.]